MTEHVSDLQWDRYLAGELTAQVGDAAHAHAGACDGCAARFRQLAMDRDAFARRPISVSFVRPTRGCLRWVRPMLATAVAVAVVVVVARRGERPTERPKGSCPVLPRTAGQPDPRSPVATGDIVHPCDYIRAGDTAARDGFGAVLSRDGARNVPVYVPPGRRQ